MRQRCKEVGLESAGKREALKRRLKEHFKNEKLIEAGKRLFFISTCTSCFVRLHLFLFEYRAFKYVLQDVSNGSRTKCTNRNFLQSVLLWG